MYTRYQRRELGIGLPEGKGGSFLLMLHEIETYPNGKFDKDFVAPAVRGIDGQMHYLLELAKEQWTSDGTFSTRVLLEVYNICTIYLGHLRQEHLLGFHHRDAEARKVRRIVSNLRRVLENPDNAHILRMIEDKQNKSARMAAVQGRVRRIIESPEYRRMAAVPELRELGALIDNAFKDRSVRYT